ncbi:MAG: Hpt domain-containing protein [Candidatus Cloacimonas sp. 4484_209]|nr:MAG: Hpt domain-containing protein [Candidatus Cloacimonas sp. 4484_209]
MNEGKITIRIDPDIADLIPGFLKNREEDITQITKCLDKNDFETIERLGHSMKGAGAGYGFDGITEIGLTIEKAAKQKDVTAIKKSLKELETYLKQVVIVNE